jgi:hypothetical protein
MLQSKQMRSLGDINGKYTVSQMKKEKSSHSSLFKVTSVLPGYEDTVHCSSLSSFYLGVVSPFLLSSTCVLQFWSNT